jgi:hypothetical protein
MIDSRFTHRRLSACTRRIAAVSIDTKAVPAFPSTEPTTLLGADTPRQHANQEPTIQRAHTHKEGCCG